VPWLLLLMVVPHPGVTSALPWVVVACCVAGLRSLESEGADEQQLPPETLELLATQPSKQLRNFAGWLTMAGWLLRWLRPAAAGGRRARARAASASILGWLPGACLAALAGAGSLVFVFVGARGEVSTIPSPFSERDLLEARRLARSMRM
jgi:hypothetical protein